MKNIIKALAVLLFSISSYAQNQEDSKWSLGLGLGPNFSQLDAVSDTLKSSWGGTLWLSNQFKNSQRFDLAYDYFSFTGSTNYHAFSGAYGWNFAGDSKPFALLGLGLGKANTFPYAVNTNQNTFHLFGRFGLDQIWTNHKNLELGLMIDAFIVKLDGNAADYAYLALPMLTLKYNFDSTEESPKSEPVAAAQVALVPVVEKIAPATNLAPVEIDSDFDGVWDSRDECPDTEPKTKVNSIGCPPKKTVKKTLRVEFKTDKATILPGYHNHVDEFAEYLKTNSDLKVTIEGHTDNVGSAKHNTKLSQARANAVKKYLVSKKVVASRIKAVGYGPKKPDVPNNSDKNRQKNRRVVALINSK